MTGDYPAYSAFLDDAAVFPPGLAPLGSAVRAHLERRRTPLADMVGPLLLALDQLPRAHALAREFVEDEGISLQSNPLQVGLIIPAGHLQEALQGAAAVAPELRISGLELKTTPMGWRGELEEFQQISTPAARYVELTGLQIAEGALAALQGGPVKLKYRTGGLEAPLFPSSSELAEVIVEAVRREVPFKLTAGLHQAVRHTGPSGFIHHGFLNIAVATALAQKGSSSADVVPVLEERDGSRLASQHLRLGAGWRTHFESFGTCSISEPLESLAGLELIPPTLL